MSYLIIFITGIILNTWAHHRHHKCFMMKQQCHREPQKFPAMKVEILLKHSNKGYNKEKLSWLNSRMGMVTSGLRKLGKNLEVFILKSKSTHGRRNSIQADAGTQTYYSVAIWSINSIICDPNCFNSSPLLEDKQQTVNGHQLKLSQKSYSALDFRNFLHFSCCNNTL